jgi:hypothetical protein
MTIQDNYLKTKEKVKKLEAKISHLEASLKWHKKIIKDAWWILTDIQANDLNADIHIYGVASMLSEIALSVLDEEYKDKTDDK